MQALNNAPPTMLKRLPEKLSSTLQMYDSISFWLEFRAVQIPEKTARHWQRSLCTHTPACVMGKVGFKSFIVNAWNTSTCTLFECPAITMQLLQAIPYIKVQNSLRFNRQQKEMSF